MNKHGFTLVELLATIVIIALIAGIATISYSALIHESNLSHFKRYQDTLHAEAAYYLSNNYDKVTFNSNKATLSLTTLNPDPINNPINHNDKCSSSYVEVTRTYVGSIASITYKVCIVCSNTSLPSGFDACKTYEN